MSGGGGLRGGAAGAVATLPMSAVLVLAERLGAPAPPPPVLLVRRLLPGLRPPADEVAGAVVHLAIGAACGALFERAVRRPALAVPFALAVWALGYEALMPLVRAVPAAHRDRSGRPVALVAAHLVFGIALGRLLRR